MGKKIYFMTENEELSESKRLEMIARAIKECKLIQRDNWLQLEYVAKYWDKLWHFSKRFEIIDDKDYNEICNLAEDLNAKQTELSFQIEKIIEKLEKKLMNV